MIALAMIGLLGLSAIFSGIEAGLMSVNRVRLRSQCDRGDPAAIRLAKLLKQPARLFATVLLTTSLANISALAIGVRLAVNAQGGWGYLTAFLLALPIFLFGTEMLPKALFQRFPYRALAFFGRLLWLARLLFLPILAPLGWLGIVRETEPGSTRRSIFAARQEMKSAAREGERLGTISADERRLIHGVIDFKAVRLADVMIPMAQVIYVNSGTPVEMAIARGLEHDLDRLPVMGKDGQFRGLVHLLDLLFDQQAGATVDQSLRRMVRAAREESAFALVRRLRAARLTMAAVVDRDGRPIGVIGNEAIMDRLVRVVVE